jgi:molecular chaperone GrpE
MKKAKVEVQDANPEEPVVTQENVVGEIPVAESTAPNATETALAELTNDLQRTRADFENFRKQVEVQKSQAMAAAKYATVTKFLPLVDDFSRAIDAYSEQLSPLRKSLDKTLQGLGLTQIESTPGVEFNPDLHEAISVEDDEGDTEVIAETLRPGYMYDGAVIRAAMVKVKHQ